MQENELLESKETRESMLGRIEVLEKVKQLNELPNDLGMTTQMVADYFEVVKSTIDALVKDNIKELSNNGYRVLMKDELTCLKKVGIIKKQVGKLGVFTRRAVLNVAMLLRDSKVAKAIRKELLDLTELDSAKEIISYNVNEKERLLLNIMTSENEVNRAIAISKYNEYVNRYTEGLEAKIAEQSPFVEMCFKRRNSQGLMTYTDIQDTYGLKKGQIGTWLKTNGYVHKTRQEVNEKGKGLFQQYGEEYPSIGITKDGLTFLDQHMYEIRQSPCRMTK